MEKRIPKIMKKVVVIGPESTGKSTLCEDLARFFKIDFLKEYARTYLELSRLIEDSSKTPIQ
ncbi:ATP-binding protein [Flavobacteriales bacterium]|nr:ATP-binding protein [Flavobacteriales bacterium]